MSHPGLLNLGCMAIWRNWHNHENFDINLKKSVDCENMVKVRWHMPGWHVHTMINVWMKYGEPRLLMSYVVCVCMASQGCSYLMLFVFVWWAKVAHVLCCLCLYVFVCVQWCPHKNDVQFVLSPVFLWFLSPVSSTVMSLWFFFFMFFAG